MGIKGVLKPNPVQVNNYQFIVAGFPELTVTEISGITQDTDTVILPDRTVVTGGNQKTVEFTVKVPAWHSEELLAWEAWRLEAIGVVLPTYKKVVAINAKNQSGTIKHIGILTGCFVAGVESPGFDMSNEGEGAYCTYKLVADLYTGLPLP